MDVETKQTTESTDVIDSIRVAFASVVSPEETKYKYDLLLNYLEDNLGKPITRIQKQTYEEVNELLKDGKVDLAFICSLSYVIGTSEGYMEDIATTIIGGKDVYQSYVITHKNSEYETLEDLKGKTFAFVDSYSYTGRLALLEMLDKRNYTKEGFFEETFYTYSHDYSVKAVARGAVDAATVDGITFDMLIEIENEDAMQLRIIEKGPWAGSPPVVVSHKIDPHLKTEIQKIFLQLKDDPVGQNILRELLIEAYVPINRENYQPIRDALHLMEDSS
nr:phosphate/phosphite/phosphonate ABC transporter substrate-binding protein [Bacillus sp. B15-48]